MPELILLCPGDRTVQVSFLQQGSGVLMESGADRLVLLRVPAITGAAYSDGRAALWLRADTALMSITSGSLKVMTCRVKVGHLVT
jgi:membrane-bound inhibitor of C-type lysozyme